MKKGIRGDLALIAACFIWGTEITIEKIGLSEITPLYFIAYRFWLGGFFLYLVFWKKIKMLNTRILIDALWVSIPLFLAYCGEIIGLQYIEPMKAGLLISFETIFVPIFFFVIYRNKFKIIEVLAIFIAFTGLVLINFDGVNFEIGIGEAFATFAASMFAISLIILGRVVNKHDTVLLTMVNLFYVGIMASIGAFIFEKPIALNSSLSVGVILYTSIICSGLAYILQAYSQRFVTAIRAGVMQSLLPIFSMFFAWLILGNTLSTIGFIGSGIVVTALFLYNVDSKYIYSLLTKNKIFKVHSKNEVA